jgi:hypothetical protein
MDDNGLAQARTGRAALRVCVASLSKFFFTPYQLNICFPLTKETKHLLLLVTCNFEYLTKHFRNTESDHKIDKKILKFPPFEFLAIQSLKSQEE